MEYIFLITAVVGFIDFTKALYARDFQTATVIAGAALIGGICGYFRINNLDIITGIQVGLAASGSYKGAALIGGKYSFDTQELSTNNPQPVDTEVK